MENLTREVILQAIQKIKENPELVKGRESFMYDLVHEGEKFPPILVLSESNKILGGNEITIRDFNNSTRKAFKYLTMNGFEVKTKNTDLPNIWFVYQGSTFNENQGKKYLWAPLKNKAGGSQFYWDNMLKVKQGDLIFNYSKGIRAVSIAKTNCYNAPNPFPDTNWQREGYKVDIDCFEFDKIIKIDQLYKQQNKIDAALHEIKNKPFDRNGGPNQGYLYEFSLEAGRLIRNLLGGTFKNDYIDDIFSGELVSEPLSGTNASALIDFSSFLSELKNSNLIFDSKIISRFAASLLTKPFLILTGLSGSGKTKLAQAFSQWICNSKDQYCIVPVGADWTNREPLLGYPNALSSAEYIKPDNGALELLIRANKYPDEPHFLILDEMNLSHVERYFADFLSVMESKEEINLYNGSQRKSSDGSLIPHAISLNENLFLIGTVNIDETTYMFSPKVLDRANVIEFRVSTSEISDFLENPKSVDLKLLERKGSNMTQSFLNLSQNQSFENDSTEINDTLVGFFKELKKLGAEFGYRSANEIVRLINQLGVIDASLTINTKLDIAIMQKLLPKLHGSRRKLTPVLLKLGEFCIESGKVEKIENDIFGVEEFDRNQAFVKYPVSLEKLIRMYKGAVENGFASYAEA